MPVTIVRIETAGPDRRARRLCFSDGAEPRTTAAAVVRALGLEPGVAIEPGTLEATLAEAELPCARDRALNYLGYRDRSRAEVAKRLVNDGYPSPIVAAVLDRLAELELLDDARFAAGWVRARSATGFGPRRIARELRERGVDDTVASEALEAESATDELDRAITALGSRRVRVAADRDRLLRRLVSRGFSFAVAREAVARVSETGEDGLEPEPFVGE